MHLLICFPGSGSLLTGVILLVVDYSNINGNKGTREANFGDASVDGNMPEEFLCFQVFQIWSYDQCRSFLRPQPEICGEVFSADEHTCSDRSFLVEAGGIYCCQHDSWKKGFTYVLGMIVAGVTGYLVIRFMLSFRIRSDCVILRFIPGPGSLFWQPIIFDF